ncbi:leucine-rich melanocyte differentiation-associated protein-like [Ruditapes philippinarum]|uniref:leucine-rich melanocyte differentiation-associated protein-like n=1 Tax=Ruditapes philippinarum TaxID=129788 RepID=UPI00295C01D8|nr:leucine-rich melanocyte differentiation-associated protein-like [Ruditapes philippinarum]
MADEPIDSGQNSEMVKEEDITEEEDFSCENFHDGQLSYVGHDIESLPQKLIEDYSKVTTRLDLSFNQVNNLLGLEEFCHLQELVLDNNEINDYTVFPHLQQLHTLTLNKNKLTDLEHLISEIKSKLPKLKYLSLLGNAACPNQLSAHDKDDEDYLRYRYKVLYNLPELKFLDSTQVTSSDMEEAKRVGPFLTVVRGTDAPITFPEESPPSPSPYSPLPNSGRTSEEHQGTYGKSKYVYYGKHSEGNRFIRNTDL